MTRKSKISAKIIYTTYHELHQLTLKQPSLAPTIYTQLKTLAQKTKIRIPKTIKNYYCNKCGNMIHLEKIRIKNKKPTYNCPYCNHHYFLKQIPHDNT